MACTKIEKILIDQLCNQTGVSRIVATNLLEACDNNLEMALNMHMEGMVTEPTPGTSSLDDNVRAPMPQKTEVLVEGPDELAYSFGGRRRTARSVFDKFRDFEVEAKRQEEMLKETQIAQKSTSNQKCKKKTLEDLFRPPLDIMFRGNFQIARDTALNDKKWLMVNIQNSSEFPCQVLNRDVWSSSAVKSLISEHFIFWQVYHDSEDGRRYMNYYPVRDWPYVSVVDPRTGECIIYWHKIDTVTFCDLIMEFLNSHVSFGEESSPQPKKRNKKCNSILEETEDAQLEAAIKASLQNDSTNPSSSNGYPASPNSHEVEDDRDSPLETFDSDSNQSEIFSAKTRAENNEVVIQDEEPLEKKAHLEEDHEAEEIPEWKKYLGLESEPPSKIILKLPDGSRDIVVMPCSSKLMALVKYVEMKGFKNETYELVTNFPKRKLSYMDFNVTLKSIGLFPQETVFIHKR